jgi:hypothetical protein
MRVLFLGAPIGPHPQSNLTTEQNFSYSGRNTGNLLIGQSLFAEIDSVEHGFGTNFTHAEVNEKFDIIVIAAANFLFKNFDFSYLATFLENTHLPIVMVGLGAQAADRSNGIVEIPAGTRRMLSVVSERTRMIGVRGHFTAEVMNNLGFKNVEPVGCPSLYRTLRRDLHLKQLPSTSNLRVSLNGSRNVTEHSYSPSDAMGLESAVLRVCIENKYSYVLQNEIPEIFIANGDDISLEYRDHIKSIVSQFKIPMDSSEYYEFIKSNFKVFFDLKSWDTYIREFDISLGSRFHGNLIALTNGVPAVLFVHDSRTAEMAEFMKIPHIPVDLMGKFSIEAAIEMADFDAFEKSYCGLYDNFARFLEKNGLKHKLANGSTGIARAGECGMAAVSTPVPSLSALSQ